jgi:hypothetical protein
MDVEPFSVIIMILILVCGGFIKILNLIRIYEQYGLMVKVLDMCII